MRNIVTLKQNMMKNLIASLVVMLLLAACGQTSTKNQESTDGKIAVANTAAELEIRGMTCETGCKKLIEKNVRKIAGVTQFDIDFAQNSAHLEFDSSITDAEKVKEVIDGLSNGAYMAIIHEVSGL